MKRKILICAALPYANGSLHLGHVAGLIGSDVLARYFRLNNDSVLYVSGSDCHGTPIAFEAEKRNLQPSEIAEKYHEEFKKTLIDGLNFSYDFFTKTTSKTHIETVQEIFLDLYEKDFIYKKTEELPYCGKCNKFLPDRYIEGECYICNFDSARGDQCDGCGSLMNTKDIINPKCKICKSVPQWKESEHFFLKLTFFQEELKEWVEKSQGWRNNAKNFTLKFLSDGLHDRSITRDIDWGVPVPIEGYETKKIYVWFEAVCGYLSASKEWSLLENKSWEDFWKDKNALHYYVHGKDNIPFHSIIWPSILLGFGELKLPDRIISSEYLTLEKKQFSKSRDWAIWVLQFLEEFDAETLRYYLIANGSENSDADFSWNEFSAKTNNELIGNFGNLVYRTLSFTYKNFQGEISSPEKLTKAEQKFLEDTEKAFTAVSYAIEQAEFRKALQLIFRLVEESNRYINSAEPWKVIKEDRNKAEQSLAVLVHVIKCISILINPFLPKTSEKIYADLNLNFSELRWKYPKMEKINIKKPQPLYNKIEEDVVEKKLQELKEKSS